MDRELNTSTVKHDGNCNSDDADPGTDGQKPKEHRCLCGCASCVNGGFGEGEKGEQVTTAKHRRVFLVGSNFGCVEQILWAITSNVVFRKNFWANFHSSFALDKNHPATYDKQTHSSMNYTDWKYPADKGGCYNARTYFSRYSWKRRKSSWQLSTTCTKCFKLRIFTSFTDTSSELPRSV